MNKNKGIIGIGLIIAIVLGIVVVGVGAYFLGKSGSKQAINNPENNLLNNQNQNLPVVNNQQADCNKNSPSTIKLISPNGGEVYQAGQKITVKWESCNVDPGSIGIGLIKHDSLIPYTQQEGLNDYRGFNLGGFDPYKGTADDGIQEITLPNNSVSKLDSGKHYFISISGTGDVTNVGSGYRPGDYSDNLFTINSSEESTTEVFNHQPGAIKSIKSDGTNKWIFAVDLLTYNSGWIPGVNDIYFNQNTKIRNLNVTSSTKTYGCVPGPDGSGPNLSTTPNANTASFVENVQKDINRRKEDFKRIGSSIEQMTDWVTYDFDINGTSITAIYTQCLP